MDSKILVNQFLTCYKTHNYKGMQNCLADNIQFSDYAFKNISGQAVKAMWHWFCVPYKERKEPIKVPELTIINSDNSHVVAQYRVQYDFGKKQRPVDYVIESHFQVQNDQIIRQRDTFSSVSEFEFAKMAFGFPLDVLSYTPLVRMTVRKKAADKLRQFMNDFEEYSSSTSNFVPSA